jgi:hypothetical protein
MQTQRLKGIGRRMMKSRLEEKPTPIVVIVDDEGRAKYPVPPIMGGLSSEGSLIIKIVEDKNQINEMN